MLEAKQNNFIEYCYPIILKNDNISNPVSLSEYILIRPLTQKEKNEYFGIAKIYFIWGSACKIKLGHVLIHTIDRADNQGRYDYKRIFDVGIYDGTSDILASNYVIVVRSHPAQIDSLVERINLSFKLLRPTSTGGYLGFKNNDTDVHFHHSFPNPIHGPYDYLLLEKNDHIELRELYKALEQKEYDKKLEGALSHFSRALENIPYKADNRIDLRFILLITVLDLLYIPDGNSTSDKMASRISVLLSHLGVTHQRVCSLYKIRNKIIHDGGCPTLSWKDFFDLTEIVRGSLIFYLKDSTVFEKNHLKRIEIVKCLKVNKQ